MTEIAGDLRKRFDFAVYWFHEKCELDPNSLQTIVDLTDDEARAVRILETLRDTVEAIPPSLIKETEELRDAWPELFEKTLVRRMGGAKRYQSAASYGDDGFRRLNPCYVLFVFLFSRLRHEPLQDSGKLFGHGHLRVGRDEPLAGCVRVVRIALREFLVFLVSHGTAHGVLVLAVDLPNAHRPVVSSERI